jgi:arsenite methyltransferase
MKPGSTSSTLISTRYGRSFLALVAVAALAAVVAGCGASCKRFFYEGFDRDDWQQPQRVVAELWIQPGDAVADIGAGGGYFTRHLAAATGESGVVHAVDVDPDMVEYVAEMARREGLSQVRSVLADPGDPKLPPGEVDLVFLSNTYHHIDDRPAYFAKVREALAPDGRVAIVEFREGVLSSLFGHATDAEQIEAEMTAAGYRLERAPEYLERQHFLIFAAREPAIGRGEAKRRADEAAQQLTGELMSRLQKAIEEGGPANAVHVCSEVAQDVTERLAAEQGLAVRRTGLRVRNPANAPDDFERDWLLRADATVRAGEQVASLYEIVDLPGGHAELRHLRPIVFPGAVCSNCHGTAEQIPAEVQAILRERYPRDQATGFQPGDLRGAISVRVPLKSSSSSD